MRYKVLQGWRDGGEVKNDSKKCYIIFEWPLTPIINANKHSFLFSQAVPLSCILIKNINLKCSINVQQYFNVVQCNNPN